MKLNDSCVSHFRGPKKTLSSRKNIRKILIRKMGKFSSITELWQNKQKPISIIHSSKKRQKKILSFLVGNIPKRKFSISKQKTFLCYEKPHHV
jgi:hypothetical protein